MGQSRKDIVKPAKEVVNNKFVLKPTITELRVTLAVVFNKNNEFFIDNNTSIAKETNPNIPCS